MQGEEVSRQAGTRGGRVAASSAEAWVFRYIFRLTMSTFYELFRECAERWPRNVALEIQRREHVESYTYAEVRGMAESIGRWIVENGFAPGSRCAIFADNHPRWGVSYLGGIAAA